jgi:hypothetical protein
MMMSVLDDRGRRCERASGGLSVLKRTENGRSARADGESIGPNALDQKNGAG